MILTIEINKYVFTIGYFTPKFQYVGNQKYVVKNSCVMKIHFKGQNDQNFSLFKLMKVIMNVINLLFLCLRKPTVK